MSSYPDDRHYTTSHEWIKMDGELGTVGITDHAQHQLGDIVYVELPDIGEIFDAGAEFGTIDSVKASSELVLPVAGEIVETNPILKDEPEAVNEDPHGEGWLVKVKMTSDGDLSGLLSAAAYEKLVEEESKG